MSQTLLIKRLLKNQLHKDEQNFFLNLAVQLKWNLATTKHQILEIHKSIISGDKTLNDYSIMLQKSYQHYLDFLMINSKND